MDISFFDFQKRVVSREELLLTIGNINYPIPVKNWVPGIYFAYIQVGGTQIVKKNVVR